MRTWALIAFSVLLWGCFQLDENSSENTGSSSSSVRTQNVESSNSGNADGGPELSDKCELLAISAKASGGADAPVNVFLQECMSELLADVVGSGGWDTCSQSVSDFVTWAATEHFKGNDGGSPNPPAYAAKVFEQGCAYLIPADMRPAEETCLDSQGVEITCVGQDSSSVEKPEPCLDADGAEVPCPEICLDSISGLEVACEPCQDEKGVWLSSQDSTDYASYESCLDLAACGTDGCLKDVPCKSEEAAALAVDSTLEIATPELDAYYLCLDSKPAE